MSDRSIPNQQQFADSSGTTERLARQKAWRSTLSLVLVFLFVSALFHGLSLLFGYKRYFLGVEVLVSFLLLAAGFVRAGVIVFVGALCLELALGLTAVFYLFKVEQLWDMAEYLFEARHAYLYVLLLPPLAVALLVRYAGRFRVVEALSLRTALVPLLTVGLLFQAQRLLASNDDTFFTPTLSERNRLVFGSAAFFANEVLAMNLAQIVGNGGQESAEYVPVRHPSGTQMVWGGGLPSSPRVLLVVAEAWGLPNDSAVLETQVAALRRNPHIQDLRLDKAHAMGATAAGELRELCGLIPTRLNFRTLTPQSIGACLPERMRGRGYATTGIHAASGSMYRRKLWWPQLGLGETLFKEDMVTGGSVCHSFPGHCDRDLAAKVKEQLQLDRSFVYWLTLNSHVPYDRRDVFDFRDNLCGHWVGQPAQEQLCDYQNLHVQFFETLSQIANDKSMAGLEVLVVGDHPPLFNAAEARGMFSRDAVPVLHFFVR